MINLKSETRINRLKQKIEDSIQESAEYVIIHQNLVKPTFSLLISPIHTNATNFLTTVETIVDSLELKENHPLVDKAVKAGSWKKLENLKKLFDCDESIQGEYGISTKDKEFIQWLFCRYLNDEYKVKIPESINLNQQPSVELDVEITTAHPLWISDDEMQSLILTLKNPETEQKVKDLIVDRIVQANTMHNSASINQNNENNTLPESNKISTEVKISEPIAEGYDEKSYAALKPAFFEKAAKERCVEKKLKNFSCYSDGEVTEDFELGLQIQKASIIVATNRWEEKLTVDNKGKFTVSLCAGIIEGLVEGATVMFSKESYKPDNGIVAVPGFDNPNHYFNPY